MKKLWAFLQSRTLEIFLAIGWTGLTLHFALEFLETGRLFLEGKVWMREHLIVQGVLVVIHIVVAVMLWSGKFSRRNQSKSSVG